MVRQEVLQSRSTIKILTIIGYTIDLKCLYAYNIAGLKRREL